MARPKGSTNKFSTKTLMAKLEDADTSPFDFWLSIMIDEKQSIKDRLTASKEIARYVLVPLEKQVETEAIQDQTDKLKAVADLLEKAKNI